MNARCIDCGRPEDEHHEFKLAVVPAGCKCDPSDWGNPLAVSAVCDEYREKPEWGTCGVCEHDRECHESRAPVTPFTAGYVTE